MSEFGPSSETEAKGLALAREIVGLRAQAANDTDYQALTQKVRELKSLFHVPSRPENRWEGIPADLKEAERILQTDCFGPAAVEKAFGVELEAKDVPIIPFSNEDLEHAKELGQMLILRVDRAPDGQPLTMKKMVEQLQPILDDEDGQILFDTTWYANEVFYITETPKLSWALASKDILPDSTSLNYLQQTDRLVDHLENEVFKDKKEKSLPLPKLYADAIEEFRRLRPEIEPLVDSDEWQIAAKRLAELQINQLTRHKLVEALYDALLVFQTTGETRLLEDVYTWTNTLESVDGNLVYFGDFDAEGARVSGWEPNGSSGILGVAFSRSQ